MFDFWIHLQIPRCDVCVCLFSAQNDRSGDGATWGEQAEAAENQEAAGTSR